MSKNDNKALKRKVIIILGICVVIGLILSVVLHLTEGEPTAAIGSIQLSFENAAEGIAPNGAKFSLDDILSDEVLESALKNVGFDTIYTTEQIRAAMTVNGVYPDNIVKQMTSYDSLLDFTTSREFNMKKFNPTQFSVALNNCFDPKVSNSDLGKLLKSILQAYKEYFIAHYSLGFSMASYDELFDLSTYDYPQMLQIIELDMSQLAQYATELYEKDPTYRYAGRGFNDFYIRLQNLIENDLVRMNANLTMNALTKNNERLLMQYECEIRDRENEMEKKNAELANLEKLLASYDKNEIIYLSTSDSLNKIDGNSSETYDFLVENKKEVADRITTLRIEINDYRLKMDDLKQNGLVPSKETVSQETTESNAAQMLLSQEAPITLDKAAQTATLEHDIESVLQAKNAILADFDEQLNAYNREKLNDGTVVTTFKKVNVPSLISGAFIVRCIKTVGPFFAIGLMICLILKLRDEKIKSA